jgi:hypothetical protein
MLHEFKCNIFSDRKRETFSSVIFFSFHSNSLLLGGLLHSTGTTYIHNIHTYTYIGVHFTEIYGGRRSEAERKGENSLGPFPKIL